MSRIRADQLVNRAGSGGPKFPNGVAEGFSVSGVVTATSFRGDGSQLSGVDASTLKDGNDIKVQATNTGATVTGTLTATAFSGDGSNITNAGSSLSAGSGTQRVVLTGQTSGTMTQSATDSVLTYNSDTDTLNVQNLNVQGTTTTIDTAITEVDSLEVEGSVGIGTTNTTNNFGTNSLLNINASSEAGRGPVYIGANKSTSLGAVVSIQAVGVAHTDANIFNGIHFSSSPGADWVAGKATRSGSGFFELRRENQNTYLQIDQNGHIVAVGMAAALLKLADHLHLVAGDVGFIHQVDVLNAAIVEGEVVDIVIVQLAGFIHQAVTGPVQVFLHKPSPFPLAEFDLIERLQLGAYIGQHGIRLGQAGQILIALADQILNQLPLQVAFALVAFRHLPFPLVFVQHDKAFGFGNGFIVRHFS